jgi:hypothetical protein
MIGDHMGMGESAKTIKARSSLLTAVHGFNIS